MTFVRSIVRPVVLAAFTLHVWLLNPPPASAQILAQSGVTKSLLGYALAALGILLGLVVVCRPANRNKVVKKRMKRIED